MIAKVEIPAISHPGRLTTGFGEDSEILGIDQFLGTCSPSAVRKFRDACTGAWLERGSLWACLQLGLDKLRNRYPGVVGDPRHGVKQGRFDAADVLKSRRGATSEIWNDGRVGSVGVQNVLTSDCVMGVKVLRTRVVLGLHIDPGGKKQWRAMDEVVQRWWQARDLEIYGAKSRESFVIWRALTSLKIFQEVKILLWITI
ncbi:hypothetical protein C8R47DRAFT_1067599 [Mycena vitilis]|nr:hypothetical protein C8R47DRAFT_1067599 [Mycena vitilis]